MPTMFFLLASAFLALSFANKMQPHYRHDDQREHQPESVPAEQSPWINGPANQKYQFHIGKQSWLAAREKCLAQNADLVTIGSQEEMQWLLAHYKPQFRYLRERQVQIGLLLEAPEEGSSTELAQMREWRWVNGRPLDANAIKWTQGEPFDHAKGKERCALLNINEQRIDDIDCDLGAGANFNYRFVCQRSHEKHVEHESLNNPLWKKLEDILTFFGISQPENEQEKAKNGTSPNGLDEEGYWDRVFTASPNGTLIGLKEREKPDEKKPDIQSGEVKKVPPTSREKEKGKEGQQQIREGDKDGEVEGVRANSSEDKGKEAKEKEEGIRDKSKLEQNKLEKNEQVENKQELNEREKIKQEEEKLEKEKQNKQEQNKLEKKEQAEIKQEEKKHEEAKQEQNKKKEEKQEETKEEQITNKQEESKQAKNKPAEKKLEKIIQEEAKQEQNKLETTKPSPSFVQASSKSAEAKADQSSSKEAAQIEQVPSNKEKPKATIVELKSNSKSKGNDENFVAAASTDNNSTSLAEKSREGKATESGQIIKAKEAEEKLGKVEKKVAKEEKLEGGKKSLEEEKPVEVPKQEKKPDLAVEKAKIEAKIEPKPEAKGSSSSKAPEKRAEEKKPEAGKKPAVLVVQDKHQDGRHGSNEGLEIVTEKKASEQKQQAAIGPNTNEDPTVVLLASAEEKPETPAATTNANKNVANNDCNRANSAACIDGGKAEQQKQQLGEANKLASANATFLSGNYSTVIQSQPEPVVLHATGAEAPSASKSKVTQKEKPKNEEKQENEEKLNNEEKPKNEEKLKEENIEKAVKKVKEVPSSPSPSTAGTDKPAIKPDPLSLVAQTLERSLSSKEEESGANEVEEEGKKHEKQEEKHEEEQEAHRKNGGPVQSRIKHLERIITAVQQMMGLGGGAGDEQDRNSVREGRQKHGEKEEKEEQKKLDKDEEEKTVQNKQEKNKNEVEKGQNKQEKAQNEQEKDKNEEKNKHKEVEKEQNKHEKNNDEESKKDQNKEERNTVGASGAKKIHQVAEAEENSKSQQASLEVDESTKEHKSKEVKQHKKDHAPAAGEHTISAHASMMAMEGDFEEAEKDAKAHPGINSGDLVRNILMASEEDEEKDCAGECEEGEEDEDGTEGRKGRKKELKEGRRKGKNGGDVDEGEAKGEARGEAEREEAKGEAREEARGGEAKGEARGEAKEEAKGEAKEEAELVPLLKSSQEEQLKKSRMEKYGRKREEEQSAEERTTPGNRLLLSKASLPMERLETKQLLHGEEEAKIKAAQKEQEKKEEATTPVNGHILDQLNHLRETKGIRQESAVEAGTAGQTKLDSKVAEDWVLHLGNGIKTARDEEGIKYVAQTEKPEKPEKSVFPRPDFRLIQRGFPEEVGQRLTEERDRVGQVYKLFNTKESIADLLQRIQQAEATRPPPLLAVPQSKRASNEIGKSVDGKSGEQQAGTDFKEYISGGIIVARP